MQISQPVRTHKIQRYLYHFTDKRHYELIQLLSRQIMSGKRDAFNLNGICMVDLENFKNQWLNTNYHFNDGNENIAYSLFRMAMRGGSEIVCIKVPTKSLDTKKIKIRDQLQFFDANFKNKINKFTNHVYLGDDVIYRDRYCDSKKPIEYIYTDDAISLDKTEVLMCENIGGIRKQFSSLKNTDEQRSYVRSILQQLFKNTPEEKGINILI